jgi:hypothetical protein
VPDGRFKWAKVSVYLIYRRMTAAMIEHAKKRNHEWGPVRAAGGLL